MNNILPGFIDSLPETADRRARIPMGRYGRADEISALVSYLCSRDAAYITGQNIRIDGGLTRSVQVPAPFRLRPRALPLDSEFRALCRHIKNTAYPRVQGTESSGA